MPNAWTRRRGRSRPAQGVERHARAHEVRREGPFPGGQRCLAGVLGGQQDQPEPFLHPQVVGQTPPQVVREDQAPAGLAAADRFAVSRLHARSAAGDPRRQEGRQRPPQREGRRDQGDHPREGRPHRHGQGLPHPWPLRRHDGHRPGLLQASRRGLSGPRHPRPQRREAPQPRVLHRAARPRRGAHRGPDQPLQHDVRSMFHGREPGRLRPRAVLGRHQAGARQRRQHQAAPSDVGAVLGRRADDVAVLPGRDPLLAQGRLQQRAGGHQRHRVREEP